ncbi:MAG: IclR family transcriptional regulator [Lachnospiraceae bacterium]|nr:IclR family transcriptional regulator [Lachnospiraceae bacterium]
MKETKEKKEDQNPIQSAGRLFQVMEVLSAGGSMGLLEISNQVGLSKSTVHRLLNSLIYMGYTRQEESTGKYRMTYKLVNLSGQILDHSDIVQIAHPYLVKLMEETGETVHLVRRERENITYIDKVEPPTATVRMISHVGLSLPLYCTGVGKALMAEMPEEEVKKIWVSSPIEKKTDYTITRLEDLSAELVRIRERGYARDDQENELGVRCVAVSIHDHRGKAVYALSISCPIYRLSDERVKELAAKMLSASASISEELGYQSKED